MNKLLSIVIAGWLVINPFVSPIIEAADEGTTALSRKKMVELRGIDVRGDEIKIALDRPVTYHTFLLENPPRLVIELSNTFQRNSEAIPVNSDILLRVRTGQFKTAPPVARVVLDLKRHVPHDIKLEGSDIVVNLSPDRAESASVEVVPVTDTVKAYAPSKKAETNRERRSGGSRLDLLGKMPRHPVSLDFEEADIRDILRVLAEVSGTNIVYGPEVSGTLSIHLDDVPFDQSFQTILTMSGLTTQQLGDNVLRVLTPEALARNRAKATLIRRTITLNHIKATDIEKHVQTFRISPSGKLSVDEENNVVIISDTPEGVAMAQRIISEIDKKPRQVLIEARIVEVTLGDDLDLGIQWEFGHNIKDGPTTLEIGRIRDGGGRADVADFTRAAAGAGAGTTEILGEATSPGSGSGGTGVSLPGPASAGIAFGIISDNTLLTAQINALATERRFKILSSPKIVTVNNKTARVEVGDQIPFRVTTVNTSGVSTESTQFVSAGVTLEVTPIINADDTVRLEVKPEANVAGENVPGLGPTISVKTAETTVIIRDGDTLVIGGLIDEQMRHTIQKVPILAEIPVLGTFFKSVVQNKDRSELLIFITPRILKDI